MKVEFTDQFIKLYKKRLSHQPHVQAKFRERTRIFEEDPTNPILEDHPLGGKKLGFRSFS